MAVVRPLRAFASLFVSLALHTCVGSPLAVMAWWMQKQAPELDLAAESVASPGVAEDMAEDVAPIPVNVTALLDEPIGAEPAAALPADPAEAPSADPRAPATTRKDQPSGTAERGAKAAELRASLSAASEESRGKKKNCDQVDGIERNGETVVVRRDVVHFYATHLKELDRVASAGFHAGPDGAADGFKLAMPRCSPLRQGGLRVGDVIHSANGHLVTNIPQVVATWFAVKGESVVKVKLTRKGQPMTLTYKLVD